MSCILLRLIAFLEEVSHLSELLLANLVLHFGYLRLELEVTILDWPLIHHLKG